MLNPQGCRLRLFDLPPDVESAKEAEDWAADVRIFEGETVYDYAWYPFMSSEDPATCVFASTSRVRTSEGCCSADAPLALC